MWDYRRFHFFDRLRLWCDPAAAMVYDPVGSDTNVIWLSEAFWQEIQAHPIPASASVVRALTGNPGCLDLYVWLSWRCFHAKRAERVPLFGSGGLVNQLGVMEYSRDRNFRKRLKEWLKLIKLYWPACPARLDEEGTSLIVEPSPGI
jgi:Plasmid encoded RepA protein